MIKFYKWKPQPTDYLSDEFFSESPDEQQAIFYYRALLGSVRFTSARAALIEIIQENAKAGRVLDFLMQKLGTAIPAEQIEKLPTIDNLPAIRVAQKRKAPTPDRFSQESITDIFASPS